MEVARLLTWVLTSEATFCFLKPIKDKKLFVLHFDTLFKVFLTFLVGMMWGKESSLSSANGVGGESLGIAGLLKIS